MTLAWSTASATRRNGVRAISAACAFCVRFSQCGRMRSVKVRLGAIALSVFRLVAAVLVVGYRLMVTPTEGALFSPIVDTRGNDRAIYQACPRRFRPIILSTMAAMFGAVPLACGAPFPRRRSATLRWHDGCQLFGTKARVRIRE